MGSSTLFGFLEGCFDNGWSQKINAAQVVLLASFVEDTPGTALWHSLYFGKRVEVRNVFVRGIGHLAGCYLSNRL